LILLRLQKK